MIRLEHIEHCFHGIIPGALATCAPDGTPNISYISQVQLVDGSHVALSCQFFNKTRQNLDQNPQASVQVYDPATFEAYVLQLRFVRAETAGPLFDSMSLRIQVIASHTGMAGVFRLLSADVCEVLSIEKVAGFLEAPSGQVDVADPRRRTALDAPLSELAGLQRVSERINRAPDLASLLRDALAALDEVFGFHHAMVLVPDDTGARLVTLASRGYGDECVGAEVRVGDGLIGTVAAQRRLIRLAGLGSDLRYGHAIRARVSEVSGATALAPEIPLPGLADATSQVAIPLMVCDDLVGVLALECSDGRAFANWHEAFLQVLGNQIAMAMERLAERGDDEDDRPAPPSVTPAATAPGRSFVFYRNDDCVFVDDEYLIRNVPGKILWKLLRVHRDEGRTEFSNRELRLDPSLGLPPIKDNLESRLILLRKRLEQKCPEVRVVPAGRGRFTLEVRCRVEMTERETA